MKLAVPTAGCIIITDH